MNKENIDIAIRPSAEEDGASRASRPSRMKAWALPLLLVAVCIGMFSNLFAPVAKAEQNYDEVVAAMSEKIQQIPGQYEAGDLDGIKTSIRQAYYENYQTSGLEDQIKHRLGDERSAEFVKALLDLRTQANSGVPAADLEKSSMDVIGKLEANVKELEDAPELNDQWTRVAGNISELLTTAKDEYAAGNFEKAYKAATDAYLAQYEANGLEKATISYIGQSRVSQLEGLYADMRQMAKDQSKSADEYAAVADELISYVQEDAKELDELTAPDAELGWRGFFASFLILLREGAEALLVVAAVVTYALKGQRRDQLMGILVGVLAALAISVGLAIVFANITASASSGFSQEFIEGITGLLAVVMLIWASNWILNKASGNKWEQYIERTAGEKAAKGGVFALAMVAFLAVLREGSETVLFYLPIIAGAKNGADHAKIWLGVGLAVLILAILFLLVWKFGVRLPMKAFFKWTSILLGLLAITIAGGAVKEFQDATIISSHRVEGMPEISLLGVYPTVESLGAQLLVIVILAVLGWLQYRQSNKSGEATVVAEAPQN
ncbi:FTR1 family protein [Propionimicrobium lymphophilum]|uniref:FTR1 family iron permease n=1 Tax=Propionimicrobium TaxID=203133 RepID=UPI0003D79D07|nr:MULTISPECIES: FTR1 family protein [Propionimicrobium]ETJ97501.1 FTR1 family protein [Propionimicrobium sp. BV2F7]MDK7710441.1 FTR1 family protein [Propionimicrobium lymphophilum]MDK7733709.1 FTR1 family protein [Propionimicrobium lymphophilum]